MLTVMAAEVLGLANAPNTVNFQTAHTTESLEATKATLGSLQTGSVCRHDSRGLQKNIPESPQQLLTRDPKA